MKAGPHLKQAHHPPLDLDAPGGWLCNPTEYLQQCRFARPVPADDANPVGDHIPQGCILLPLLVVQGVFLAQAFDGDSGGHRLSVARSRCSLKTQSRKGRREAITVS